ncbi:25S rRNA (adenine(2142)-N(1))-methyltransferase [Colletotrichum fructicola]|nr:25S rRNA (adenine(2142)-N(1))-methyltransferase [Colletotrichum fructicola]
MARQKPTPKLLSSGRPPTLKKAKSISRKETRTLINTHHTLQKKRQQALARNDEKEAAALAAKISALGGLKEYQQASLQGQRTDRGGDSSKVLLDWLRSANLQSTKTMAAATSDNHGSERRRLRMLEPGILQQDFMERPLPKDDTERFDIISLSLVLNYVPDHSLRGEMLLRTLSFLRQPNDDLPESARNIFPSLFVVLPKSCISNSRYFSQARLVELMTLLGYAQVGVKLTNKLAYSFWKRQGPAQQPMTPFTKTEVNPGVTRNNFAITLKAS